MRVFEAIAKGLETEQVETVFGLIGDGNLFFVDDFVRTRNGRFVSLPHEGAGVLAAGGYAAATGGVGVASVTHGPAFSNTVTALTDAARGRRPLVLLAGATDVRDQHNLQSLDQREVTAVTGAGFQQVRAADTVVDDLLESFRRARTERRPIVLDIPVNFQWEEIGDPFSSVQGSAAVIQPFAPSDDSLDDALGIIASASRPVVVAGLGVVRADAEADALAFARRIGAPVLTTLKASGLFHDEPELLGVMGGFSDERALEVVNGADCVIALGAGLTEWTTAEGSLLSGKKVVHVDDEAGALNRFEAVDAPVHADAGAAARAFVRLLDEAEIPASGYSSSLPAAPVRSRQPEAFEIDEIFRRIDRAFESDRTLITDCGRFFIPAAQELSVSTPGAYIPTVDFGAIGLGMASAIGAGVGAPDRPVLAVCGDGGFMLAGLAEFNAAVRHGIDLVTVVINDSSYGAEYVQFAAKGMDPGISTFDWPSFAELAAALGGVGYSVSDYDQLDSALAEVENRDRPVLIEVNIDPADIEVAVH